MFTGIIEELGKVRLITQNKLQIVCKTVLEGTKLGDSIAVNGVCLTVTELNNDSFTADVSFETLNVSALGNLKKDDIVNLERALMLSDRLGGHIVSGHIDGMGKCLSINKNSEFYDFNFEIPKELLKYVVKKGSITINGISLTIAEIDNNIIRLAIIPHTFENTNLKTLKTGDIINIETDILSKYVEKFLSTSDNRSSIDLDFLVKNGF
ncbi:MAG: riboflavin synthase [bacterium]|nr:riboflavin synthase [bacterium]